MASFEVMTRARTEFVDITAQVQAAVADCKVDSGICFVYVPHTTAAVTVNEACDADVAADITRSLAKLVPHDSGYAHSEGNADAHIKATMVGTCQAIPVEDGRLTLGQWQGVFFCEFDGPRRRRCLVKVMEDN
jgi:secondary thiamine-phosphate synthase enzyme